MICCQYYLERSVNQVLWEKFMGDLGINCDHVFNNDIFIVKAYIWADDGDDDSDPNEWHFWHKPSGLKVQWYKYPLRSCMCNMPGISHEFFLEVLKDCYNSMDDNKFTYECHEWWNEKI